MKKTFSILPIAAVGAGLVALWALTKKSSTEPNAGVRIGAKRRFLDWDQILSARGVGPSDIGPLFAPNAYVPQQPRGVQGPAMVVPQPYAPTNEKQVRTFEPSVIADPFVVSPPFSETANDPGINGPGPESFFIPQRGGVTSAAAALRAALGSPVR